MTQRLLATVASHLDHCRISYALIGAAALAVRGVARSTFDLDLLATDVRALDADTWCDLVDQGPRVTIRRGDAEDPLAGVVRIEAADERPVDVIVGRPGWQDGAVRRAEPIEIEGSVIPVVQASDLILLKLYAGGSQDSWDIEQLLAAGDRERVIAAVDREVGSLPAHARARWRPGSE
jgi:hypothetical protein